MRQLKKVTRFFGIVVLALLVIALGAAAKHGQFDPPSQHGHFLSKSVKMENASHVECVADSPVPIHTWLQFKVHTVPVEARVCPVVAAIADDLVLPLRV